MLCWGSLTKEDCTHLQKKRVESIRHWVVVAVAQLDLLFQLFAFFFFRLGGRQQQVVLTPMLRELPQHILLGCAV